jgi:hypothetical protein
MSGMDGSQKKAVALLIEEKHELGEGGYDASTQPSFPMLKYWVQSNVRQFLLPWVISLTCHARMMPFKGNVVALHS